MNTRISTAVTAIVLLVALPLSVSAVSVYQWVDADGVTHFSDETPTASKPVKQLSQYDIEDNFPQSRDPGEDYFSIVNQWKRTSEERDAALKQKREAKRERRASRQQQAQVVVQEPRRVYTGFLPSPFLFNQGRFFRRNQFLNRPQPPMQPTGPIPGYVGNVSSSN